MSIKQIIYLTNDIVKYIIIKYEAKYFSKQIQRLIFKFHLKYQRINNTSKIINHFKIGYSIKLTRVQVI